MLTVKMTPNLLGISVTGDYHDLDKLYDAIWTLDWLDEDAEVPEVERCMRERLLALCYDLRHAYQGDRGVELVDNGMDADKAQWTGHEDVTTYHNLVYSVEILYPEAMYELICLSWLIERRQAKLLGKRSVAYDDVTSAKVLLDEPCARVRLYQSLVMEAIGAQVTSNMLGRIRTQVCERYGHVARMYPQWLDIINYDWMEMTPKQRAKGFSTTARDIADHWLHDQYREVKADVDAFVQETGAPIANVSVNVEYPETYEW